MECLAFKTFHIVYSSSGVSFLILNIILNMLDIILGGLTTTTFICSPPIRILNIILDML